MKTVQGIRMNSSVKRIWLTCAAVALLLGWNLPGIQGDGWFNFHSVPNLSHIENDHLRNHSFENCAEKRFFKWFNVSCKVDEYLQSITMKVAWITTENIWFVQCYGSVELDGVQIAPSGSGNTNLCHDERLKCPLLKGELFQSPSVTYPIPLVMNKGDYLAKGYCKNQDEAVILCVRWKFTWV